MTDEVIYEVTIVWYLKAKNAKEAGDKAREAGLENCSEIYITQKTDEEELE